MSNKLFILITCSMILLAGDCYAKSPKKISLEQASETIRKKFNGKVLSARTIRNISGTKTHKIKIITPDGRVKMHTVDERKSPENKFFQDKNRKQLNSFNQSKYRNSHQQRSNTTSKTTTKKQ